VADASQAALLASAGLQSRDLVVAALLERAEERPLAELDEVEVVGPHGQIRELDALVRSRFPNTGCWAKGCHRRIAMRSRCSSRERGRVVT